MSVSIQTVRHSGDALHHAVVKGSIRIEEGVLLPDGGIVVIGVLNSSGKRELCQKVAVDLRDPWVI